MALTFKKHRRELHRVTTLDVWGPDMVADTPRSLGSAPAEPVRSPVASPA